MALASLPFRLPKGVKKSYTTPHLISRTYGDFGLRLVRTLKCHNSPRGGAAGGAVLPRGVLCRAMRWEVENWRSYDHSTRKDFSIYRARSLRSLAHLSRAGLYKTILMIDRASEASAEKNWVMRV